MNEMDKIRDYDEDAGIDFKRVFSEAIKYWWIIVIATLAAGAISLSYCAVAKKPLYQSVTGVYVMSYNEKTDTMSYSDTQLATQLAKDFARLIMSRTVLENVIESLDLKMSVEGLKSRVSVSNVKDTRLLDIYVKDRNPEMAQKIADSVREIAIVQIKNVTKGAMVTMVDKASLPKAPVEPSKKKWLFMGFFAGFALSAGALVARGVLDDTIKTSEDVERELGWSTLALIPIVNLEDRSELLKKSNAGKKTVKTPVKVRSQAGTDKK